MQKHFTLAAVALAASLCFHLAPAHGAGLMVSDTGGLLDIEQHDVHVTLNNGIAVTQVTQVFRNTESRTVEALYTFPVPANASVAGFSMWIDGREMIGEAVEKRAAREIYSHYKAQNRDPGILEQSDYRTFELRIFPIAANATQKVQVTYYQEIDSDGEWTTYVYPLASNARDIVNSRVSKSFSLTADIKSIAPIAEVRSPSHGTTMSPIRFTPTYARANLSANSASLDRDVVLTYRTEKNKTGASLLAFTPTGSDGYFCLMLNAGPELKPADAGMDYVILLDISGSMRDDDKIGQSRGTLGALVEMLGKNDRFDVLAFNTAATAAFGQLNNADDPHKATASQFLNSRHARGGTDLNAALAAAYQYATPGRAMNVVVISDGLTEQDQLPALARRVNGRPNQCRILCVGVGNDVDHALLDRMADATGGLTAYVSTNDDFHRQAESLRRKLHRPAITDVSVEFAGVAVHDIEAQHVRNLYDGVPIRMYGRYGAGGQAVVTLKGMADGKPYSRELPVTFPQQADADPQIARMWAWRRVNRLLSEPGLSTSGIDEIIRLGETYSIATEYTSFIVLENDAEYAKWKIAQRNALRLTADHDAQSAVEADLKSLRERAPEGLGIPGAVSRTKSPATPALAASPQSAPGDPALAVRNALPDPHAGGAMDPTYVVLALVLVAGLFFASSPKTGKTRCD